MRLDGSDGLDALDADRFQHPRQGQPPGIPRGCPAVQPAALLMLYLTDVKFGQNDGAVVHLGLTWENSLNFSSTKPRDEPELLRM